MRHRTIVLGGGYAGVAAARTLARRARGATTVTLINAEPDFVERIRLHQVAAGQTLPRRPLATLDRLGIEIVVGHAVRVEPDQHRVVLAEGREVGYDRLVIALGSTARRPDVPTGATEPLFVAVRPDAIRAARTISAIADGGVVSVIGGGLTGVETATELAASHPGIQVRLVTGEQAGQWLKPRGRERLLAELGQLRIDVLERTRVVAADPDLRFVDGTALSSDATIWAIGFSPSPLAANAGLAVNSAGQLLVDEGLRSISHPEILGAGDIAALSNASTHQLRMACQTAIPMGVKAADTIARELAARPVPAFRMRYVWTNLSIGRDRGLSQPTHADDSPRRFVVGGAAAARFKELVSWSTVAYLGMRVDGGRTARLGDFHDGTPRIRP